MFWNGIEREPPHLIELVRFAVSDWGRINEHLKVECDPMGLFPLVLAVHVAVAEKLVAYHIRRVFFSNFFPQCGIYRISKFKPASTNVSPPVFITGIAISFCH